MHLFGDTHVMEVTWIEHKHEAAPSTCQNSLKMSQVQRLFETSMPRDASASRVKNRCVLTGRGHSVHRFARVSRIMVRQLAHYGLLPGVSKAAW